MPRDAIPYAAADVSALAKSLRTQWAGRATSPSHVEMLNMLARAAGHRNFQQFRARRTVAEASPDALVARALRYFDASGRLRAWPSRQSVQDLCLWALWARIPRAQMFDERGISALLDTLHTFGDAAILRRTMVQLGMMTRSEGRDYRRVERAPPAQALALFNGLHV